MQTKNQISLTRKALYGIMLIAVFFAAFGGENLPSVRAQESGKRRNISTFAQSDVQFYPLLSNSLLLYSPTVLDFDVQSFLNSQSGPLRNYSEQIDGQTWTAAEIIRFNAILFGINPQFIIISLEADGNLITNNNVEIPLSQSPNAADGTQPTFYFFVNRIANKAVSAFDDRRFHQGEDSIIFQSGESLGVPKELNPGTYATHSSFNHF